MEVSTRVRKQQVFVADGHSADRDALDILARRIPDAYVAWEGNDIILTSGQRVRGRFVLWVPQSATEIFESVEEDEGLEFAPPELDPVPLHRAAPPITYPAPPPAPPAPPANGFNGQTITTDRRQPVIPDDELWEDEPEVEEEELDAEELDAEELDAEELDAEELDAEELDAEQPDAVIATAEPPAETSDEAPRRRTRGPKTVKYKSITRIDHEPKRTHGYFVRVTWKKETRSKFFSDKKYGDRLAALDEAIKWRDQTERDMGKPRTERLVIGAARTSTGIVGVRRMIKEGSEVYEVTWRKPGNKIGRTSFSIAKHGEKRALALARRERERRERERQFSPPDA